MVLHITTLCTAHHNTSLTQIFWTEGGLHLLGAGYVDNREGFIETKQVWRLAHDSSREYYWDSTTLPPLGNTVLGSTTHTITNYMITDGVIDLQAATLVGVPDSFLRSFGAPWGD